mgnify:CR=1 FL=1
MQEQLLTDRQRTPHRVLLDKKIFAEPPVRPLGQGFLGGRNGRRKLGALAHTETDSGFGLRGIGGGFRELVQQTHCPAVAVRLDEKGAYHAFFGVVPVQKKAEPDDEDACGHQPQPAPAGHRAASAFTGPSARRSQSSRTARTIKPKRKIAAASQRSRNAASKREMPPKLHARSSS